MSLIPAGLRCAAVRVGVDILYVAGIGNYVPSGGSAGAQAGGEGIDGAGTGVEIGYGDGAGAGVEVGVGTGDGVGNGAGAGSGTDADAEFEAVAQVRAEVDSEAKPGVGVGAGVDAAAVIAVGGESFSLQASPPCSSQSPYFFFWIGAAIELPGLVIFLDKFI